MRMLALKTWRDILARKGQFAALILLVALGISSYVAFQESYRNLGTSAELAYRELRFADFDVTVVAAPAVAVDKVKRVPGVAAAEGRLVVDTGMQLSSADQGTVRVVGVPAERASMVNSLLLESGRMLEPSDRESGLLHAKFAEDNGVRAGDTLVVKAGGLDHPIDIVGLVASPEYMFPVRSKNEIPSLSEFTIIFMPQHEVERLFGRPNTITNIAVRVAEGHDPDRVMDAVEERLAGYQVVAATPRADQPSNFMLSEEMDQNRVLASLMPMLILVISSLSLAIALSRLVQSQRGEIGLAKALGYSDRQILGHYLMFSVFVAVIGCALGVLVGHLLAIAITGEYTRLLGVPYLDSGLHADVALTAATMSIVACVIAGLVPAWLSARLRPAQAMHADPNIAVTGGSRTLLERILGPLMPASIVARIPLRNVFRAKRRSLYTVIGIAFAVTLTLGTSAFFDSMNWMLDHVFEEVEVWDISAVYEQQMTDSHVRDVESWPGVERVQPALIVPVEMTANGEKHEGVVTAMAAGSEFHGFDIVRGADSDGALRQNGLILPGRLADKLKVDVGDTVSLESPYRDEVVPVKVATISEESWGLPAYTGIERGAELAASARPVYNALYVDATPRETTALRQRLFELPNASQVTVKQSLVDMINSMMSFSYFFFAVLLAFGFAMAFVVIYNTFTANVIERTREIATMRTIGEDGAHLAGMITAENLILAIVGIPLGVWLGRITAQAVLDQMSSEQFAMRIVVQPTTYAWVLLAAVVVLLLSEIPPIRRIFKLDLAEATKYIE